MPEYPFSIRKQIILVKQSYEFSEHFHCDFTSFIRRKLSDSINRKEIVESEVPLDYLEESMSMMGISGEQSMGNRAIGARISERSLRQRDPSVNYSLESDGDVLRGVRRRSISRPTKRTPSTTETMDLRSIEKIYMKKTLGRMKNTDLETIFESVSDDEADIDGKPMKNSPTAFGLRKLKRRLTFSATGPTKALKEKRKKRAHSILGGRKRFKKVSMQFFIDHLNALNAIQSGEKEDVAEVVTASGENIDLIEPIIGQ